MAIKKNILFNKKNKVSSVLILNFAWGLGPFLSEETLYIPNPMVNTKL